MKLNSCMRYDQLYEMPALRNTQECDGELAGPHEFTPANIDAVIMCFAHLTLMR